MSGPATSLPPTTSRFIGRSIEAQVLRRRAAPVMGCSSTGREYYDSATLLSQLGLIPAGA